MCRKVGGWVGRRVCNWVGRYVIGDLHDYCHAYLWYQ